MLNFIDKTPLTSDELAFQCAALSHAALFSQEPAVTEALLFVLLEKIDLLYDMLPEGVVRDEQGDSDHVI